MTILLLERQLRNLRSSIARASGYLDPWGLDYPDQNDLTGVMTRKAGEREQINAVVEAMGHSRSVLVITGAGISADSGIAINPAKNADQESAMNNHSESIEEIFSAKKLQDNPRQLWTYIQQLTKSHQAVTPSRAHQIIAKMEQSFERLWVLTQNVDGLHQRSGSKNVIEIHGNIHRLYCPSCKRKTIFQIDADMDSLPPCAACGTIMRPDIIMFGETLDPDTSELYRREMDKNFDLVFSIGTSSQFPYIQRPMRNAAFHGHFTVEINPADTPVSNWVDVHLKTSADAALIQIWESYVKMKN